MNSSYDGYILGILYNIGGFYDNKFVLRHHSKYFLDLVKKSLQINNQIYHQYDKKPAGQYVLKINGEIIKSILDTDYSPRNAMYRCYPKKLNDDFVRSSIELHATMGWQTKYSFDNKNKKYYGCRFRFYANIEICNQIADYLYTNVGIKNRPTPQTAKGNSAYIQIASYDSIVAIYNYFYKKPCYVPFWELMNNYIEIKNTIKPIQLKISN